MKKPIEARRHYTLVQRLRLMPLIDRLKKHRNSMVSRLYESRPAENFAEFEQALGDTAEASLVFTIAFNLPWAIELMARSVRVHMPEWRLVVVDNSSKPECRTEIAAICARHGVPYLSLPKNIEWSPNRSHGTALNWVWRNVIAPRRPRHFGFIDHDCFPFRRTDEFERISRQPVDGLRLAPRFVDNAWFLWAGCMFFNSRLIGDVDLDFNHLQALRLDTAGANWERLYRHLDPATLTFLPQQVVALPVPGRGGDTVEVVEIGGTLLHVIGASYRTGGDYAGRVAAVTAAVEASLPAAAGAGEPSA